ncbi:MAG: carboxylating nicotinate-nucleotide diphosphorylase [Actinomycetales bacterium]|nr:carboxylating nicotinate-nucleotide diphosphorylase [Actinomycetales bacterium]
MSRHRADGQHVAGWQPELESAVVAAGLDPESVRDVVVRALDEDLGPRRQDVTTAATIPAEQERSALLVARADGVVAGLPLWPIVLAEAAAMLDLPVPTTTLAVTDGARVRTGDVLGQFHGRSQVLLVAERTALNLVCRLSGIATHTRAWADALAGTRARVLDTRKTTPGLRMLEKYAVRCGGGMNKRMGLFDIAMIKDNHKVAAGSIKAAYTQVRTRYPEVEVEVEVDTPDEAEEAVAAGARFLLFDNMSVDVLAAAVAKARAATPEPILLEATGGLTLDEARAYADTGVDYLSVGALTHSSPGLDLALDLLPPDTPAAGAAG